MKIRIPHEFWRKLILERIHRLLAIVIVWQLIHVFTNYWWEETYTIVYGALTITAITELLFTRRFLARFAFQCLCIVGLIIWNTPFRWLRWPEDERMWDHLWPLIDNHAEQLHPFFALAAGIVIAAHVLSWMVQTRQGAITVILLAVTVMAAVDSYFPLELWHHIAWIIVVGLCLLVVLHLRQLQARHPDSWEALAERPLDIIIPAVAIITLVLLTGIFMPRAPVLLEDPYTIWTEAQGRVVPSFGGEGGVDKASGKGKGSATSGYGRDDATIGGGFEYDYSPVMTVATTQRSYWRGESKAIYTGKGWGDIRNQHQMPTFGNDEDFPLTTPPGDEAKTLEVVQTVTVLRNEKLDVLFAASPVSNISELESDNNNGLLWNPEELELSWDKPTKVESYSVLSQVPILDEALLRSVGPSSEDSIDLGKYLQLPDRLPDRVRQLAEAQTSGLMNDYDRAKALEQYLKSTFTYTNTPDVSKQLDRENGDIVDAFLFEIQEGYCDYFSTSFVVMARSIGLPARWVKGYSTGYDPVAIEFERVNVPDAPRDASNSGTYTVRNSDAHSWAEVFFEGVGWIPFEPTAGFTVPLPVPEGQVLTPDAVIASNPTPVEEVSNSNSNWLVPVGAVVVILILLALVYFAYHNRHVGRLFSRIKYRGNTPNQRVVREMEKLLSFLRRRGLQRESHETIRETFNHWSTKFSSLKGDFDGVLIHFERARYGYDKGNDDQTLKEFNEAAERIRKAI